MKKYFLVILVIAGLLFTAKAKAQEEDIYQKAIDLLQEQLNNPDLSKTDKESIREALKETKEIKNNLQSDSPIYDTSDTPVYEYKPPPPPPDALPPEPTKEINNTNNKGSKTLRSGQAN